MRLQTSSVFFLAFLIAQMMLARSGLSQTVAYYTFSNGTPGSAATGTGSILDSSGNGLNGTPHDSPIYSSNVPTTPFPTTASLQFFGTGQAVSIPDYPALALTQSLTIEAYVNVTNVHQQPYGQMIVMRGDDRSGLDPYLIQVLGEGSNPSVFQFGVTNASNQSVYVSTPIPALNQWIEVAGTLNNTTGVLDLYLNGVLESSTTTTIRPFGTLDSSEDPGVGVGNLEDPSENTAETFDGLISDVRISNQALAPSQFLINSVPEPSMMSLLCIAASGLLLGGRGASPKHHGNAES